MSELGAHGDQTGPEAQHVIDRGIGRRRSDRIVGAARATQEIIDQAMAAARGDLPVVLTGPAGSGKEHTARAIHAWSDRAAQRFIVVSCAAVSEPLLSREIFGAADGVYSLLPGDYVGALARAEGGSVLISGVERLPDRMRQALLAAIKTRSFKRDGEQLSTPLRARVMVTTTGQPDNSPLGDLPQHTIRTVSLADRHEDVLPLAAHFLRLYADEDGIQPVGFTTDARNAMLAEEWPGNVRELAERIRQAVKLAGNGSISAEALMLAAEGENVLSFKEAKRAFETRYVVGLLRRCGGNISRAARLAKKDRKDFYDVIRRTGVDPAEFR
jgi:two-component system response regulator GlrR